MERVMRSLSRTSRVNGYGIGNLKRGGHPRTPVRGDIKIRGGRGHSRESWREGGKAKSKNRLPRGVGVGGGRASWRRDSKSEGKSKIRETQSSSRAAMGRKESYGRPEIGFRKGRRAW